MDQGASSIHPGPAPNSQHRKIELQSPQDLAYLQKNLVASARRQLDLQFPLSALPNDEVARTQPAIVISLDGVKPADQESSTQKVQSQEAPE